MNGCGHIDHKGRRCLRGFHALGPHVYTRLSQIGRRKKRTRAAEDAFRAELIDRSEGWCEATRLLADAHPATRKDICGSVILHAGHHAHHLHPEDRDVDLHDPERGLWLCERAHRYAHDYPLAAQALGLLRPLKAER